MTAFASAHAMVARAKPVVVMPEFLPFLMMSDRFMKRAVEISVGSLSPTINWTTLKLEEFDLPPLDLQRRIAEILWAVDETENNYCKLQSSLEVAFKANAAQLFPSIKKTKQSIRPAFRALHKTITKWSLQRTRLFGSWNKACEHGRAFW